MNWRSSALSLKRAMLNVSWREGERSVNGVGWSNLVEIRVVNRADEDVEGGADRTTDSLRLALVPKPDEKVEEGYEEKDADK